MCHAVTADDQALKDLSIDPRESLIPELGVFGKSLNSTLALLNCLRSRTGIYVMATTAGNEDSGTGLATGDVIVSLSGMPILSVQELRGAIHELTRDKPAIVEVERHGRYLYVERELEQRPSDSSTDRTAKAIR